ncbi:hypothetical protein HMPREF1555_00077 [Porphyromonas gingivalis F0570]|uniref:Uncharacterized protein n=1 Tax=Porphyromonas gingivalis F0570 TaxID=1227271 RepID=A0A0E2LTT3_PORGN|nr:hypothetical protein HMPREF1553_00780 [Porphyromonas gingivalis F0568]ERJ69036.1 hypothetical protein HMPREF1555_00077 [Porphyromonas gingivalis F0570]
MLGSSLFLHIPMTIIMYWLHGHTTCEKNFSALVLQISKLRYTFAVYYLANTHIYGREICPL